MAQSVDAAAYNEQSGGRLAITVYPNSALRADTAMLPKCVSCAVEMCMPRGDLLTPRVPAAALKKRTD